MPSAALRETFENLPLSALRRTDRDEDPTVFLPRLFGPGTHVRPFVECGDTGAWIGGWTVLVDTDRGWVGFVLPDYENDTSVEWERLTRGKRIDRLSRAITTPVAEAGTLVDLAVGLAGKCTGLPWTAADGHDAAQVGGFPGISKYAEGWLLKHALDVLAADNQRQAGETLLVLNGSTEALALVRSLDCIDTNWEAGHVAEALYTEIAAEYGVTLSGYLIERMQITEPLFGFPRREWPDRARALLTGNGEWERLETEARKAREKAEAEARARKHRQQMAQEGSKSLPPWPFVICA